MKRLSVGVCESGPGLNGSDANALIHRCAHLAGMRVKRIEFCRERRADINPIVGAVGSVKIELLHTMGCDSTNQLFRIAHSTPPYCYSIQSADRRCPMVWMGMLTTRKKHCYTQNPFFIGTKNRISLRIVSCSPVVVPKETNEHLVHHFGPIIPGRSPLDLYPLS